MGGVICVRPVCVSGWVGVWVGVWYEWNVSREIHYVDMDSIMQH